jgi:hypothetical protein
MFPVEGVIAVCSGQRDLKKPEYLIPCSRTMKNNLSPLKLRGHHLICLHFFRGEGYAPEFIALLGEILKRAVTGEQIEIVSDADDVCHICPYLRGEECFYHQESDQEIREMDRKALELLELKARDIVLWKHVRDKIPYVFYRWSQEFCSACYWNKACLKDSYFNQLFNEKTRS